jgi:hypothetical protein
MNSSRYAATSFEVDAERRREIIAADARHGNGRSRVFAAIERLRGGFAGSASTGDRPARATRLDHTRV